MNSSKSSVVYFRSSTNDLKKLQDFRDDSCTYQKCYWNLYAVFQTCNAACFRIVCFMREKLAKKDEGEFQGATRSSGSESEMFAGSLVFLLSVNEWMTRKKEKTRMDVSEAKESEKKKVIYLLFRSIML